LALVPQKFIEDATVKNKQVSEMGLRAKLINNLMKGMIIPAMKTSTSMLIVNHIYDDPAAMYTSKIKNQGGGKGAQYAAHLILQCSKKFEKNDASKVEGSYSRATVLKFFVTKNRVVKPFYDTELFLDFEKGPLKWFGLVRPAIKYGFLEQYGAYYVVPSHGEKKWFLKHLLKEDEPWETFLDEFNKRSLEDLSYNGAANGDLDALDEADEDYLQEMTKEEKPSE
jgi:hypothetical protein